MDQNIILLNIIQAVSKSVNYLNLNSLHRFTAQIKRNSNLDAHNTEAVACKIF